MKEEYWEELNKVITNRGLRLLDIKDVNLEALFPHIKNIEKLLKRSTQYTIPGTKLHLGMPVATPPLIVSNIYHRIILGNGKIWHSSLERPITLVMPTEEYAEEAMEYAEKHWPEDLREDDWEDIITISLEKHLQTKESVTIALDKPLKKIKGVNNEYLERHISAVTNDTAEITELNVYRTAEHINALETAVRKRTAIDRRRIPTDALAYRTHQVMFNCAFDGEALNKTGCPRCGRTLKYPLEGKNWGRTIPEVAARYLKDQGYQWKRLPTSMTKPHVISL